eukprot:Selendium_serpulae@DN5769_c1_g1_i3.p1
MGCSKSKNKVEHPSGATTSPGTGTATTQSPMQSAPRHRDSTNRQPMPTESPNDARNGYALNTGDPDGRGDFDADNGDGSELVTRGPVKLPDDIEYTGQWKGRRKHGRGVQRWPDGAVFDGEWVDGMANGQGTFTHNDGDTYCGQWIHDKANGYGVYTHHDNSTEGFVSPAININPENL